MKYDSLTSIFCNLNACMTGCFENFQPYFTVSYFHPSPYISTCRLYDRQISVCKIQAWSMNSSSNSTLSMNKMNVTSFLSISDGYEKDDVPLFLGKMVVLIKPVFSLGLPRHPCSFLTASLLNQKYASTCKTVVLPKLPTKPVDLCMLQHRGANSIELDQFKSNWTRLKCFSLHEILCTWERIPQNTQITILRSTQTTFSSPSPRVWFSTVSHNTIKFGTYHRVQTRLFTT